MPKSSPIQNAFNGGQFGPRMQGRTDLARYRTGCNSLRNFLLTMQGPAVKRSGTRFVLQTKDSTKASRLLSFEFSRDQAYILEFGDLYMRVYRNNGIVLEDTNSGNSIFSASTTNPVQITTVGIHPLTTGDRVYISGSLMTELNGRWFTITSTGVSTFTLDGENGTSRITGSGGTAKRPFEIATPYTSAQLADIQTAQSQDVMWLAHPLVPPQKVERTSDTEWTMTEIAFDPPPFRDENATDTTVSSNGTTGATITLTASTPIFTSAMVTSGTKIKLSEIPSEWYPKWQANATSVNPWVSGGVFAVGSTAPNFQRIYYENNVYKVTDLSAADTGHDPPVHKEGQQYDRRVGWTYINSGFGFGTITAIGAGDPSTTCTLDVSTSGIELPVSVSTATHSDRAGVATKKWSFGAWDAFNGYPRAVAFYEDRLWFAGTDSDPQGFWASRTGQYENFEILGNEDDSGLFFVLASEKINAIEWMAGEDSLFIGTRGSEFTADSGSASDAITPANIRVRRRSNYGSASNIQPLSVDSNILFVQRSRRRLHELVFDFNSDRYVAPDLTDLSYDILNSGTVEVAYQASPFRQVWALVGDGTLAALTYIRDQDVIGWAPHVIGGTDTFVESIAVIPHPDGDEDQLWLIVRRTVNNSTVRYVEFLEKPFENSDSLSSAFFLDSGLSYVNPNLLVSSSMSTLFSTTTLVQFAVDPTPFFSVGDTVYVSGVVVLDPEDAAFQALVEGIPLTVTGVDASTKLITVEDASGNPIDMTTVIGSFSGSWYGTFTISRHVSIVSGLDHLESETVRIMGDGIQLSDAVVSGGEVVLSSPSSVVHAGLAEPPARIQTMRLDAGMEGIGTAQGRRKRIHQMVIRLDNTGDGLKFGTSLLGTLDSWDRTSEALSNGLVPLYSGDTPSFEIPGGWSRDGRVAIEHDSALPCTIVSLMPQLKTEGR